MRFNVDDIQFGKAQFMELGSDYPLTNSQQETMIASTFLKGWHNALAILTRCLYVV